MKIKNTSKERQSVHTVDGVVFIHPGKTRDVELSEPGKKLIETSEVLKEVGKPAPKAAGKQKDVPDVHGEGEAHPAQGSVEGANKPHGSVEGEGGPAIWRG